MPIKTSNTIGVFRSGSIRRLLTVLLAASLTLFIATLSASPAEAADGTFAGCKIGVDKPHASHHNPEYVNIVFRAENCGRAINIVVDSNFDYTIEEPGGITSRASIARTSG